MLGADWNRELHISQELKFDADGILYVGGVFTDADGVILRRISGNLEWIDFGAN